MASVIWGTYGILFDDRVYYMTSNEESSVSSRYMSQVVPKDGKTA